MSEYKQILCSRSNMRYVCWTDNDPNLKPGNSIRFKDEEDFWTIVRVFGPTMERTEINRSWHVGGL